MFYLVQLLFCAFCRIDMEENNKISIMWIAFIKSLYISKSKILFQFVHVELLKLKKVGLIN